MATNEDPEAPKHVMISYQWDSQMRSIQLRDKLKEEGYNVWMDINSMGGDTGSSMAKAVEGAEVVLMCVSKKYQGSRNCKKEAEYADELNKTIIPLMMEDRFKPSDWLGLLMGKKLYYRCQDHAEMEKQFPGLIRALGDKGKIVGVAKWTPVKRSGSKALQCPICLERFKNPKTLPCLHSFCKECLVRLAPPGTTSITCPQCRKKHIVPDGDVTQFPTNFHLKELVEEEAMRQQITGGGCEFPCTCCDVGKQSGVVGRCEDCNFYICREGLAAHKRFKTLTNHKVFVFETKTEVDPSTQTKAEKKSEPEFEMDVNDWELFDTMYNEDHSTPLLMFWMQLYQGDQKWQSAMVRHYLACLEKLEEECVVCEDDLAKRQLQVVNVFKQAGQYQKAVEVLEKALKTESEELGGRPEWLADLYHLTCAIYEEMVNATLNGNIQQDTLKKYIQYARKSYKIRKTLKGDDHKYELGKTLNRLSDGLRLWAFCGEGPPSKEAAKKEAKTHIDNSIKILKELGATGSLAKATRDKGNLLPEASEEQEKMYKEAIALSVEAYGEYNYIAGSLYWNLSLTYDQRSDMYESYKWLDKCRDTYEKVYGEHHPHTQMIYTELDDPYYEEVAKVFKK